MKISTSKSKAAIPAPIIVVLRRMAIANSRLPFFSYGVEGGKKVELSVFPQRSNLLSRQEPPLSAHRIRALRRRAVVRVSQNPRNIQALKEKDLGACSHFEAFRYPHRVADTRLLQNDVRATQHAGHEYAHRERLRYLAVHFCPSEVLLVDPKLAFHLGEHLAVLPVRMIARMRCGLKHVGRPAADCLFADEMEVEGLEYVVEERPVFLILAEPCSLLGRRFVLKLVEILVAFLLFLG